ncbi:hypothetical protein A2960_04645 [Candidatus Gottesmanbacteria bacterium RIFCSPLOWO2_01_FULL_39_12b]|uniref:Cell wall hydrolase SleB domain-containing protein n=1 Tax=Candidatus Gottesmanbacteria bacterium RIFCSPLOWO2_01_FULL_39_12b TaxID=1798388 RepID=A0A1F6APL8_9BACT|nr:MAG: hypothetical protein A2960_04645 [Candidatus Gottesmanbacteria bacterium RIFCSPLOWO2_01_FULL_39_12b]
MQLIFEDRNRRVVSDEERLTFSGFLSLYLFVIKVRETKNFVIHIDEKEIFSIKPARELQIIYLVTFLQGKDHTLSLEKRQKNSSLTLESFEVFALQPDTTLTLEINSQAEDGDRRPWVTCLLNNLSLRSFTYTLTYSRRKRDSDDVKIIVDNNVQGSLLKTIKYRLWRLIGSFLPLFSPTKTEKETITLNLIQQFHLIEFIADRMPTLYSLSLDFGSIPSTSMRVPTVDNPLWTGDFYDDSEEIILARALFGEGRNTLIPDEARIAIGWVIKNRVKSNRWPNSYREVITQPFQFSAFNVDDENRLYVENPLHTGNAIDQEAWKHAYKIAGQIINGELPDPTQGANHYYDDSIATPDWAKGETPTLSVNYKNALGTDNTIFFYKL